MYNRLYQNMLSQHNWVESAASFTSVHNDSSLFGLYATAAPQQSGLLVDTMSSQLEGMSKPVDADELTRAKNQLKASVCRNLEQRATILEDMARQTMAFGKVTPASELCAQIDAVQGADIQRVATDMLKTPLSMAVYGNLSYAPRYDVVAGRFA